MVQLKYHLSEKAVKQLFLDAKDYSVERSVEFSFSTLTPIARQAWFNLYGTRDYADLKIYTVIHGEVYSDGSTESCPPEANTKWDWLEQDTILMPDTVSGAILQALVSKREAEAEAAHRLPAWQEAHERYQQAQAEAKKQAEAVKEAQTIEKLEKRISALEGYLEALIKASDSKTLQKAGLVRGVGEGGEEPEGVTPEQQEALETVGLDC